MVEHKRIGILTSGGDCAGLNAAIRAVVYHAVGTYNWEVLGIRQATYGLMDVLHRHLNLRLRTLIPY